MRVFPKPNHLGDWKCPICNLSDDGEVILAAIQGTQVGRISEAMQIHLNCVELTIHDSVGIIFMRYKDTD